MNYKDVQAIILAAGKSTRFNTQKSKLLEHICGQEMILYTTKLLEKLKIHTTCILGFKREEVQACLARNHNNTIASVIQEEQKGTGHALMISKPLWNKDHILVINGDTPLIKNETIEKLIQKHTKTNAAISFVTSHYSEPSSYGRVIESENRIEIVENKHFTGSPEEHCCINAGIYIIKKDFLTNYLSTITQNNITHEFYITDLVKIASDANLTVTTVSAPYDQIRGVNTLKELWAVEQIRRSEILAHWMDEGVRFYAPHTNYIDINSTIGQGSSIGAGVRLYGKTTIGTNVTVEPYCIFYDAHIETNAHIKPYTIIEQSSIKTQALVGPFAHVRQNSIVHQSAQIGNFVEVKNTTIDSHSKAKHLTYLGDTTIGTHTNIGAGTITCNYDGTSKHRTTIKNNAFIGSNNTIIAPVTIGNNAITAGGSVITEDVPNNALALGRSRQTNKPEYATCLREKQNKNKLLFTAAVKTNPLHENNI